MYSEHKIPQKSNWVFELQLKCQLFLMSLVFINGTWHHQNCLRTRRGTRPLEFSSGSLCTSLVKTSVSTLKMLNTHPYLSAAVLKQKPPCLMRNPTYFNDLEKRHLSSNHEGRSEGTSMDNFFSLFSTLHKKAAGSSYTNQLKIIHVWTWPCYLAI